MSLSRYIIRRLLATLPIIIGALTLSFFLTRAMPGNPFLLNITRNSAAEIAYYNTLVERYGLDQPVYIQYIKYLNNLFTGNWGNSFTIQNGKPVWELIELRFPRTMELAVISMFFASIIGVRVGVISATKRNKWQDTIIRGIALLGVAIPVFWLGLLLKIVLAGELNLLPGIGYTDITLEAPPRITGSLLLDSLFAGEIEYFLTTASYYVMPVFCLSFITLASIVRQSRSSMLEVLELDYIRTARAKGCKERKVINTHALRNALIPTITIIGLNLGGLLGGAVLTETTFNFKGIGTLLITAIASRDYPVINACVFLITFIFVIVNLITDVLYGIMDPRIRF